MIQSQRRFDLRIAVITAIALLFAQIGAMTHAYAHIQGTDRVAAHGSTGGAHEICGDCLNFAPLLTAAGSPAGVALPPTAAPRVHAEGADTSRPAAPPRLSFRSRAPPVPR